jgi:glycosyltransferase 2 family protein
MRNRLGTLLKVVITVAGLAFIISQTEPAAAVRLILRANPLWVLAALLLVMLSIIVRAFRWRLLLLGLGVRLPLLKLIRLYFIGHFFNAFLPAVMSCAS